MTKKALVIGGHGASGRAIVEHLSSLPDWNVIGVARNSPNFETKISFISCDISDMSDCKAKLSLPDITHVFYAARQSGRDLSEESSINLRMLCNVVEVIEKVASNLTHINLMHGMKAYGTLLGPFKTPAVETDPRIIPPMYYYDQEDFIRDRSAHGRWTWSTLRPGAICNLSIGTSGSLVSILAVYGSICRELGIPLWFPGTEGGFNALRQVVDSGLLARAATWVSTQGQCANQIFNVNNGDAIRWKNLWPSIANFFGLEPAGPIAIRLKEAMADKSALWDAITQKHGLRSHSFTKLVSWGYSDVFHNNWDSIASTIKLQQSGFHEVTDTATSICILMGKLREQRIIP